MKIKLLAALLTVVVLSAFTLTGSNSEKNVATVERQQGVYVFLLSKPVADHEYLGTVKIKMSWSGKPDELLSTSIKKVKKEYPDADGIIFTSIDMDKADAIKFK